MKRPRGGETGSGSVLAIGLVGAATALALAVAFVLSALPVKRRIDGAADAAALAAADTLSGRTSGIPCETADRIAAANGGRLAGCEVDGLVVTVTVVTSALGVPVTGRATAGPAP